jgi:tetratricopeptide (TPR) repeat protein
MLCGLFAMPLWPQAGYERGAFEGTVKDRNGQPLVGATVIIERTDIKAEYKTKTDKNGRFFHPFIPGGVRPVYTVRIVHEGRVLWERKRLKIAFESQGDIGGGVVMLAERTRLNIDLAQEAAEVERQMTAEQRAEIEKAKAEQGKLEALQQRFERGVALLQQKDYAGAIVELEAARDVNPSAGLVWAQLGAAYEGAGRVDDAAAAFQQATELEPTNPAYWTRLGSALVKAGRVEEADKAFARAAQINPAQAAALYFEQGVTFYNAGKLGEAVEPLRKATELNPAHADAHYLLGVCLYSTAETKIEGNEVKTILKPGTREAFEKYLELAPDGRYANDAKGMLAVLDTQVPASVRMKKK